MLKIPLLYISALLLVIPAAVGPAWSQSGDYGPGVVIYDDGQGNNLSGPAGVAYDGERLIVADSRNSRLLFYTLRGKSLELVKEAKLDREIQPATVQFGKSGDVLVYDSKGKDILRFNTGGGKLGKVELKGVPGSSRVIIKSFRVDGSGDLILLDVYGRRVLIAGEKGVFKRQIPFPDEFGFISDLAVDNRGTIFLIDSVRSQLLAAASDASVFTPVSGSLRDILAYPTHMEIDSKGLIYLVDEETSSIKVLRRDGSFKQSLFNRGRKEGLLYYPAQICVGDGSRLVIADRDNNRIQVFVERE